MNTQKEANGNNQNIIDINNNIKNELEKLRIYINNFLLHPIKI